MKVRSPLIWMGGKSKMAEEIINKMPNHDCFVDLFGGAAHVIAQKYPICNEVYNDIDGEVVNFIMMARTRTEELEGACSSLPYSRELYKQWKNEPPPTDPFDKAVRFFYLNRSGIAKGNSQQSFNTKTGWRHSREHNTARTYQTACTAIRQFAKRMSNVMIDNRDFRDVVRVYDSPTTLFYVDPPYVDKEKYYALTPEDKLNPMKLHQDLGELMNTIQGKAIISYYEQPVLDDMYSNWKKETIQTVRQVVNGTNNKAEEVIYMNYETKQLSLF